MSKILVDHIDKVKPTQAAMLEIEMVLSLESPPENKACSKEPPPRAVLLKILQI